MELGTTECTVCAKAFTPKFRYQLREVGGKFEAFCSQACQERAIGRDEARDCSVCTKSFTLEFAYQAHVTDGTTRYFCTPECRVDGIAHPVTDAAATIPSTATRKRVRRIAVFNHKGGTGKTTTAINLAAGLAERGQRVLLVDVDGQGNVGASLGIRGEKSLYHVLVTGMSVSSVAVPVRSNLDVVTSNELLAAAELHLATRPNRSRVMRDRLGASADHYDVVVLDCAPALSLMNQNALAYADSVVIPVSCDYLSLVGVKQVLRTLKQVRELLKHEVELLGVVPTFFDTRARICRDSMQALREHFGDRCLAPIRVNTKLREAPSARQTIFEYAPQSHGAEDYLSLVDSILHMQAEHRPDVATPVEGPVPVAETSFEHTAVA